MCLCSVFLHLCLCSEMSFEVGMAMAKTVRLRGVIFLNIDQWNIIKEVGHESVNYTDLYN